MEQTRWFDTSARPFASEFLGVVTVTGYARNLLG